MKEIVGVNIPKGLELLSTTDNVNDIIKNITVEDYSRLKTYIEENRRKLQFNKPKFNYMGQKISFDDALEVYLHYLNEK